MARKRPSFRGGRDGGEDSRSPEIPVKVNSIFYRGFKGVRIERCLSVSEDFIESCLRKPVRQAVSQTLGSYLRSRHGRIESSGSRKFHLQFQTKVPDIIFTESKVVSEGNSSMELVLLDAFSNERVVSGDLSSAKVKIFVLHSQFDGEDWTADEFNIRVVRRRQDKRPLLTGELTVSLHEGAASLDDIKFTDNSSWCKSKKFRLGAQPVSDSYQTTVREAVSNPFKVNEHRGESYKKLHPPFLDSEVWRLDYIGRNGKNHAILEQAGVSTVAQLLKLYFSDKHSLNQLLKDCSENKRNIIVEHALTCPPGSKRYRYQSSLGGPVMSFDSGGRLVGVILDGGSCYLSVDDLNQSQKEWVEMTKHSAYQNIQFWQEVGEASYAQALAPSPGLGLYPEEDQLLFNMSDLERCP